jgi:hypothetical protein
VTTSYLSFRFLEYSCEPGRILPSVRLWILKGDEYRPWFFDVFFESFVIVPFTASYFIFLIPLFYVAWKSGNMGILNLTANDNIFTIISAVVFSQIMFKVRAKHLNVFESVNLDQIDSLQKEQIQSLLVRRKVLIPLLLAQV